MNSYKPRRQSTTTTWNGGKSAGDTRIKRTAVRLGASLIILLAMLGIRAWMPGASETLGVFFGTALSGGPDYRAALGALGEVISGTGELSAVWNALGGGEAEPVTADMPTVSLGTSEDGAAALTTNGASANGDVTTDSANGGDTSTNGGVTPDTTADGSGGGDYAEKLDMSARRELVESVLNGEDEDVTEVSSTYLTVEEGEDEEEFIDKIYYDKIDIDFDYQNPLDGTVTSGFGYRIHPLTGKRSFHYGIDIGDKEGTAIGAFADGTVEQVGYNSVYGNFLFIRHKDGVLTFYGHCKKVAATEGQLVRLGEQVATVGSTGWSTGPHLHFEVRTGETILDPSHYYQK